MSAASQTSPVPLDMVDALLEMVAGVIHDRPVQGLVAGKLLMESSGADDPLLTRARQAVGRAGEQSRDVMWALHRPRLRADHLRDDLEETLARIADPATGLRVSVDLDPQLPWEWVEVLCGAVHDVLAGAVLRGGHAAVVELTGDRVGLRALVRTTGHPTPGPDDPWLALARARLGAGTGAGTVVVLPPQPDASQDEAPAQTIALTLRSES